MRSRNFIPGLLLIVLGAIFLAGNLGAFEFWEYWPVIIILLGVAFFGIWLRERPNYGLLMPASVLTIVGILFLIYFLRQSASEPGQPVPSPAS